MTDPPVCRFVLSVPPPSTNNIYRGGPRFKTGAYESWATSSGWEVQAQHVKPVPGRLRVRIEVPFRKNRDLDNIKPLLDLAVSLGLIEDDNRVDELTIVRVPAKEATVVAIWPLANGAEADVA